MNPTSEPNLRRQRIRAAVNELCTSLGIEPNRTTGINIDGGLITYTTIEDPTAVRNPATGEFDTTTGIATLG